MKILVLLLTAATMLLGQNNKEIRVIAFGAHPDDCDIRAAGTAALFAKMGYAVRFVSVTNGDAGHETMSGPALAARRLREAKESGRRLGIDYVVLNNHDGQLLPTLEVREQIIRQIRAWKADVVLAPRPNDYHPDHRYTGVLVQDAAYMVVVPSVTPDVPALRKNPVFLYYEDRFQRPNPFRPDIAVRIDDVIDQKVDALDAHESQFYDWLPWVDGKLAEVPKDHTERKEWLKRERTPTITPAVRAALVKWYGPETGNATKYYEAFEICEYGAQPDEARIRQLFPMLHR
ncbi:MAG TPA: PIG-L family deacetylase [Bryobacteraceae bacterium]|nr:PIG-L family deacetylase [Bryobacteraceae bacterium]